MSLTLKQRAANALRASDLRLLVATTTSRSDGCARPTQVGALEAAIDGARAGGCRKHGCKLLGAVERRCGGQGLVQLRRWRPVDPEQVALKLDHDPRRVRATCTTQPS